MHQRPLAVIVLRTEISHLIVGGLSLTERWSRALKVNGLVAKEVPASELAGFLADAGSSVLLVDGDAVIDDEAISKIASASCADAEMVVFRDDDSEVAPVLLLGASAVSAASQAGAMLEGDYASLAAGLSERGTLCLRSEQIYRLFFCRVTDPKSAKAATWGLLRHMKFRYGGLVAKLLNRPVSAVITGLIINSKITPNMVTTVAGLLALLSSYMLLQADYYWALAATMVLHFASILDGTDGEIAKMKFQFSTFGKYYDSGVDEVTNALFFAALGYHCSVVHDFGYFFPMGVYAGAVSFTYAMVNWHTKIKYGHGVYWWFDKVGTKALAEREPSLAKQWKTLFGRDAYILFSVLLGAVNLLPVLVVAMFGVTAVILPLLFVHIFIMRAKW